ncbi:MAG: SdpI family protein [Clostridia bacterium]|nr:SdpI family protein [Clostridia bacterium]
MIKKNLKTLVITTAVILLPILAGLILWDKLPEEIATHFNAQGVADGFSSKAFGVFGLPVILAALHWICTLGTNADPKQKNHSDKMQTLVLWICPLISLLVSSVIYTYAMGIDVDILSITTLLFGAMFIVTGNYLPKCKQNYTMGIKLPWTLNDEENWNYTHRITGKVWVAGGVVILLTAAFRQAWILFIITLVMVVIPFVLSYLFHRKKNKKS